MSTSNSAQQVAQEEFAQELVCEECSANCCEWESSEDFESCAETGLCLSCCQTAYEDYVREVRETALA